MKKIIFVMMIFTMMVSCKNETSTKKTPQNKESELNESISLIGKKFEYNYGEAVYEVEFKTKDSLQWKCIKGDEKGKSANEIYVMQRLNNHTLFVSWVEADGLGVSQILNLKDNSVHTFLKIDKELIPLSGKIREM